MDTRKLDAQADNDNNEEESYDRISTKQRNENEMSNWWLIVFYVAINGFLLLPASPENRKKRFHVIQARDFRNVINRQRETLGNDESSATSEKDQVRIISI